jgi:HPt (histidine-containing phosphotransfer) domain-containing protein
MRAVSIEPIASEFADDPDMRELLVEFAAGLAETCQRLHAAVEQGEWTAVRRIGHQLKGAGGGYGYPSLSDAGARLEVAVASANGPSVEVSAAVENLIGLCKRVQAGLTPA